MHPKYIADYFLAYPDLPACFETFDGVLHPSKEVAESWVNPYINKEIKQHDNPAFDKSEQEPADPAGEPPADPGGEPPADNGEDGQ